MLSLSHRMLAAQSIDIWWPRKETQQSTIWLELFTSSLIHSNFKISLPNGWWASSCLPHILIEQSIISFKVCLNVILSHRNCRFCLPAQNILGPFQNLSWGKSCLQTHIKERSYLKLQESVLGVLTLAAPVEEKQNDHHRLKILICWEALLCCK